MVVLCFNFIKIHFNELEAFYKIWDGHSNIAHLLFKRIYLACGANSSDPDFGRQAFLGYCSNVSNETKLEVVNKLKMEIIESWK